jgi:hypothetical protein
MSITSDNTIAKILRTIEQCGGVASTTDIKRRAAEFNRSGGMERLKKLLADLVAKGILLLQKNKANNGQTVESYSIANSKVNGSSNHCINGSSANDGSLSINVALDITLDRFLEIVHSLINVDDGKDDSDGYDNAEEYSEEGDTFSDDDTPGGHSENAPDDGDEVPF